MNYPFKDNMIAFLLGNIDAECLNAHFMSIFENYPKETLYSLMNIIGTHDTMRIKTLLGGLSQDCGTQKLSSGNEELATYRLKNAVFCTDDICGRSMYILWCRSRNAGRQRPV